MLRYFILILFCLRVAYSQEPHHSCAHVDTTNITGIKDLTEIEGIWYTHLIYDKGAVSNLRPSHGKVIIKTQPPAIAYATLYGNDRHDNSKKCVHWAFLLVQCGPESPCFFTQRLKPERLPGGEHLVYIENDALFFYRCFKFGENGNCQHKLGRAMTRHMHLTEAQKKPFMKHFNELGIPTVDITCQSPATNNCELEANGFVDHKNQCTDK